MRQLKSYIALFLLVLFIFPFVEKEIHDLRHINDFHCPVKTTKHFHEAEHICSVCDFTFFSANTTIDPLFKVSAVFCCDIIFVCLPEETLTSPNYHFSLRAPPVA